MQGFDNEVSQFIDKHDLITPGSRILVACSGGVDSMTLLHYLAVNQERFAIQVAAVHVDHMLRGQSSVQDGVLVKEICEQLSIPFYGGWVPVPEIIKEVGGNVQMICRDGRYNYFDEIMSKESYDFLVTGHHAEDQLETVLMQLTKGTAPLGMPIKRSVKNGFLIRPFLAVSKSMLYHYAEEYHVPFREDPSNEEDHYMRNRYRHSIMPKLLEENPALVNSITSLTVDMQGDELFLQHLAKEQIQTHVMFTKEGYPSMSLEVFQRMALALQRRAIPLLLDYLYQNEKVPIYYKDDLVLQILKHLQSSDGNVSIDLPNGFEFTRSYDQFYFAPRLNTQRQQMTLLQGQKVKWDENAWFYWEKIKNVDHNIVLQANEVMFFNLPKSALPLKVRQRKNGDRILLKGMSNAKRLSRLFIDEKISKRLRDELPVVVTNEGMVCAVPGVRYGSGFTTQQEEHNKYIFIKGNK